MKRHLVNRPIRLGLRLGQRKEVMVVAERETKDEPQEKNPAKHRS